MWALRRFKNGGEIMPINSKQKGSGFELKVAKQLSSWSGYKFNRTPMSGALHWENDTRVVSDIVPPQNLKWPFSIECKKVEYDYDFTFILKGTSTFWEHWKQAKDDATRENMIPMLVFSKNYRDTHVAIQVDVFVKLFNKKEKPSYLSIHFGTDDLVVLNFEQFLESTTMEDILNL